MFKLKQSHRDVVHNACTRIVVREPALKDEMTAMQNFFCNKRSLAFFAINRQHEALMLKLMHDVMRRSAFFHMRRAIEMKFEHLSSLDMHAQTADALLRVLRNYGDYISPVSGTNVVPLKPVGA